VRFRANWFRAVLTRSASVIGVAALVAVTAVSAGRQSEGRESIRNSAGNVVKVDGEFITSARQSVGDGRTITPRTSPAIAKLPDDHRGRPHQDIESIVVSRGRHKANTWLVGMTRELRQVRTSARSPGRNLSAADVSFGRDVMCSARSRRTNLFPGQDPIGKTVRVGESEFDVIGIQNRSGKLADENLDNRIFVPLPRRRACLLGGVNTSCTSTALCAREADIEPALDEIESILREHHKLPSSYPDDFSVEDQASIVKEGQRATATFRLLTFALGGIALLVGGIGIMNMMLVSVRERNARDRHLVCRSDCRSLDGSRCKFLGGHKPSY
jgi:putative ABC transport system permease protein